MSVHFGANYGKIWKTVVLKDSDQRPVKLPIRLRVTDAGAAIFSACPPGWTEVICAGTEHELLAMLTAALGRYATEPTAISTVKLDVDRPLAGSRDADETLTLYLWRRDVDMFVTPNGSRYRYAGYDMTYAGEPTDDNTASAVSDAEGAYVIVMPDALSVESDTALRKFSRELAAVAFRLLDGVDTQAELQRRCDAVATALRQIRPANPPVKKARKR